MEKNDFFKKQIILKSISQSSKTNDTSFLNNSNKPKKSFKILKVFLLICLVFIIAFSSIVAYYISLLPSPLDIEKKVEIESSKIFDREGNILYEIHAEGKRTLMHYKEIPQVIINATIALEDDEFFKHKGVDITAFLYALFRYTVFGDKSRGGSTITQQLVKNTLLSNVKTVDRKFKEIILSIMTEQTYTKEKIMEMYLNKIPYGNNAYGIFAASKTYFNKVPADLTIAEAAFLVSIPQRPTYYNPYGPNLKELLKRKDYVIHRMRDLGMITEEQAYEALNQKIEIQPYKEKILHPHFVMYVKDLVAKKYGEDIFQRGGLKIYTTLDPKMQSIAEKVVKEGIEKKGKKFNASNAALVAANPKTGEIYAMVGSIDYFNKEIDGQFNVALGWRQPGSSIKPLAYLAAFMKGYTPATVVWDVPTDFGNGYKPQNYDLKFRGPVTLRDALAQSLNIPAVKVLYLAGLENVMNLGKELGLNYLTEDKSKYGLSFVLGGSEVRLLDMVQMYSVFANQGMKNDLYPILKIVDKDGYTIETFPKPQNKELIDPGFIYLLTNILSDNKARAPVFGVNNSLTLPNRPVAAKTGTTNSYKDAWILGYTPSLVAGVWVGNNDGKVMKEATSYLIAGPIWQNFMKEALKDTPIEKFEKPKNIVTKEISTLTGKLPSEFTPKSKIRYEIFVKGMEPTEKDDYLIFKKVEKITNKLATENCPKEAIEYWVYENAHCIRPDLPNWEIPVKNYVQTFHPITSIENGEYDVKFVSLDKIPTEKATWCDDPNYLKKINFDFIYPKNNEKILNNSSIPIQFEADDPNSIKEIKIYINDNLITTFENGKLSGNITLANIENGKKYTIKAIMTSKYFYTITKSVNVIFSNDLNPLKFDILSPKNESTFKSGEIIDINIKIDDNDFGRIDLYINGKFRNSLTILNDDNTISYSLDTKSLAVGKNKLTFFGYDKEGNESSNIIWININE